MANVQLRRQLVQFVVIKPGSVDRVTQGFVGNVVANQSTQPEAIDQSLFQCGHTNLNSFEVSNLDSRLVLLWIHANHAKYRKGRRGTVVPWNCNPDFRRILGPNIVNAECGQEAENRARHGFGHFDIGMVFRRVGFGVDVDSARDSYQAALFRESVEVLRGGPKVPDIGRSHSPLV